MPPTYSRPVLSTDDFRRMALLSDEEDQGPMASAPDFNKPDEMVTFYIGREENPTRFIIHQEVACEASPVLRRVFDGQNSTYRMNDTTPEAFKYLMKWFYRKTIRFPLHDCSIEQDDVEMSAEDHLSQCSKEDNTLVELWVLAARLRIPEVQNMAIDQIHRTYERCCPTVLTLNYVYANTAADSPLRSLLVLQVAWGVKQSTYSHKNKDYFPIEFLLDLAKVFSAHVPIKGMERLKGNICVDTFHVYRTEDPAPEPATGANSLEGS